MISRKNTRFGRSFKNALEIIHALQGESYTNMQVITIKYHQSQGWQQYQKITASIAATWLANKQKRNACLRDLAFVLRL
jgi:hypothetical protein